MTPPIAEPTRMPARAGSTPSAPGVRPRLARGRDGEHDVPLEPPRLLRADDRLRLEALHLGGDPHGEPARVERPDPVDAAPPRDRRVPGRLRVEPERRDRSQTGDGDAAHDHGQRSSLQAHGSVANGPHASRSSGRPSWTPRSRSLPWRPSSSASSRRGTSGSTSPSGTASAASSRTGAASCACGRATPGRSSATSPSSGRSGSCCPHASALDGEIVIERDGVLDFDAMQTRLHPAESRVNKLSAEIPARFIAFDVLVWKGEEVWREALSKRRTRLERSAQALRALPGDARPRGSARLARPLRGDRPRRRDREAPRPRVPPRLPRRRREGEAREDGRLRRRRRALEGADPIASPRSSSACTRTTATSTTSAPRRSRRPATTRSRAASGRCSRTRPSAASRSRTAGAAASSRSRRYGPSWWSRCATTRCSRTASGTARSSSASATTRTRRSARGASSARRSARPTRSLSAEVPASESAIADSAREDP